ncbi:hypothetical protein BJV78DRAFT_1259443 [Lactifluus subvellereus]|nr:hypothetical protein BJV78DRAFT_1259443 [Lactifluus subvellereus]
MSASKINPPVTLRKRLTKEDLHDLLIIWGRDQRVPSLTSRRKWALHRGLAPSTVSGWFYRRRTRHIRLVGSAPALTDSYDLNPGSPSNATLYEISSKEQTHGARSPDIGSNWADLGLNSDDTVDLAATTEHVTSNTPDQLEDGNMSFAIDLSGTFQTAPFLSFNGEPELFALSNRTGVDLPNTERVLSPMLPCECVLCVSGALGMFLKS